MSTQNLQNEQGRSMAEMLGVLAVIGVLTIIGITAFRYALNRHYANDLLHEVHRVAYSYSGHLLTAGNGAAFDVNSVEPAAADASFTLKPYEDYFMVGVEGVEKAVCEQAAGTELPVSFQRRVYCDEGAMEFYFANDMGACDDEEKCALPEVCTEGQNQCGRLCCEQGETCMPGRCCPKGMYIAATNTCCEEGTVPKIVNNEYACEEPAQGDNCLNDDFTTNQALCNKITEETSQKLYCKVTSFSGCTPNAATCQPLPTISTALLTKAGTYDMGTWKKADEQMDWYSAKNFCEALEMELPTQSSFCSGQNCNTVATPSQLHNSLVYYWSGAGTAGGLWLETKESCQAYLGNCYDNSYWINNQDKSATNNRAICQPKNYEEPDCPSGLVYNVIDDTCAKECSSHADCTGLEGTHYCRFNLTSVDSQCTVANLKGTCKPLPTISTATLTKAGGTLPMGTWKKAEETMDWWSAKDLCEVLEMELPSYDSFCGTDHDCTNDATPRRVNNGLRYDFYNQGKKGLWLNEKEACTAYAVNYYAAENSYWANDPLKKELRQAICQPPNYQEPDCPTGTYDPASDTCQ